MAGTAGMQTCGQVHTHLGHRHLQAFTRPFTYVAIWQRQPPNKGGFLVLALKARFLSFISQVLKD